MKKVAVAGASGATGKLLVAALLKRNVEVVAIVRAASSLQDTFGDDTNYREVNGSISEMSDADIGTVLDGCDVVLSCLGHNLTFGGIYGQPRRLVTDAVKKICRAIESSGTERKIRVILMNTTGNANRDIPERPPLSQRIVVAILRVLLPPHVDNEQAADYLRTQIGQSHRCIEWAAVRPDGLIDQDAESDVEIHPSPIRNAIFDAGQTSRINVAGFMATLATDDDVWDSWKGKMPVIYNTP